MKGYKQLALRVKEADAQRAVAALEAAGIPARYQRHRTGTYFFVLVPSPVNTKRAVAVLERANPYWGMKALTHKLAARPDVRSAGGLGSWIGRAKYGKQRFQKAAAAGRPLGHNPNALIHDIPQPLFKRARKKAIGLAQRDADRTGRMVAIIDSAAGRVFKFVRPRPQRNPGLKVRRAAGHVRLRKVGGRTRIEVYR